ncbi:MAG: tyrosine-protein phosphatase [Clostridia bacterium]|nr:tyrosine-protein phosphatase [Clostridia bacterium]
MTNLIFPEDGAVVSQKTDVMRLFEMNIRKNAWVWRWGMFASDKDGVLTRPEPVCFKWETDDESALFALAYDPDFTEPVPHKVSGNTAEAVNLLLGRKYYWKVGDSEVRSFFTEDNPPRWIYTERAANVRDIGGYVTPEGRRVRQGMIYRGTMIFEEGDPEGLRTLHDDLGIVLELDLRAPDEAEGRNSSLIGDDVKYIRIESEAYSEFLEWGFNIPKYFGILTDPSNYPMYIHCMIGADRTGTLVAVILSLIGLDPEQVMREYELSTVAFPNDHRTRDEIGWKEFAKTLGVFGKNFTERIHNFVLANGVTEEQIEKLREIMLEP